MNTPSRILVVDDDNDLVLGTTLRLRHAGYAVDTASDGVEALEQMDQETYDMVLMDIRMPRMNGLEALEKIIGNPRTESIPVVIFSASPGDQVLALDSGAKYFLRKPIENSTLLATIKSLVTCEPATS